MKLTGPPSTICRAKKSRCEMSLPEVLLWQQLRRRPAGLKWRHQHPAGPYELDFYCDAPASVLRQAPSTTAFGGGPPPPVGEDLR